MDASGYGLQPSPDPPSGLESETTPSELPDRIREYALRPKPKSSLAPDLAEILRRAGIVMTTLPDLSIIVVSFQTRELLRKCLQSIYKYPPRSPFEVIVVDNASVDGSAQLVASEYPDVRLITNSLNVGFAVANNQALHVAKGRFFLLLNSDTEVTPSALTALLDFMEDTPAAGLANPKLIYPDGRLQPAPSKLPTFWKDAVWESIFWGTPVHRLFGKAYSLKALEPGRDYDAVADVEWVRGAAMMVRREVAAAIGLLDENFFFGQEEIDYCIRSSRAGWHHFYCPSSVIVHHGSASHRPFGRAIGRKIHEGRLYYWDKHGGLFATTILRAILGVLTSATILYRGFKLPFVHDRGAEVQKWRFDLQLLGLVVFGKYPRFNKGKDLA